MNKTILVTGGCGYIGSHTIVALIESGFSVVSIDNNSRSHGWITDRIEQLTGVKIKNLVVDICDFEATKTVFEQINNIEGIIHFAAYKAVGESMQKPMLYYQNNLFGMINILQLAQQYKVPNLVFSSSCTVYGDAQTLPVTENSPLLNPTSPYGRTKSMGETMLQDLVKVSNIQVVSLRYFNPVGAHPSLLLGELPLGVPDNLVPYITQTAIGKREQLTIFGNDYPTRDGTCIRDYVHVCDIADAHVSALQWLMAKENKNQLSAFNLGIGNGISVLEAVNAFKEVNQVPLKFGYGPRRAGDVPAIYADNQLAKAVLNWQPKFSLHAMMQTAWEWEKALSSK